jgi:hypothetical protein
MTNRIPAAAFRTGAWLAIALTCLNGSIILFDGISGPLEPKYRLVTLIVGVGFWLIAALIFGLERNLTRIYRHQGRHGSAENSGAMASSWRVVFLVLAVAVLGLSGLMALALVGIVERLSQGTTLFG